MGIDNAFNVPTDAMDEFFSSHALAYNIGKILGKSGTIAVLSLLAGLFLGGGAAAAGGATLALGGAMVVVSSSVIAIEWSALTAGSLSLSVSDHSSGSGEVEEGESDSDDLKNIYNSIKESPNCPEGFQPRKNGTTKNTVKNNELLEKLRGIEAGTWKKIYKDGYAAYGNEVSIHYFQSESGKVFDVKVKPGWSN